MLGKRHAANLKVTDRETDYDLIDALDAIKKFKSTDSSKLADLNFLIASNASIKS